MKRILRWIFIPVLSFFSMILFLLLLLVGIFAFLNHSNRINSLALWFMNKNLVGEMRFDSLHFDFSAFPIIGVSARNGLLLSGISSYPSDTLCSFDALNAQMNPFQILRNNLIDIPYVYLHSPYALVSLTKEGVPDWNIWRFVKKPTRKATSKTPIQLNIHHVLLTGHSRFYYDNLHTGMRISADAHTLFLKGRIAINYKKLDADTLHINRLNFSMQLPGDTAYFHIGADSILIHKQNRQTFQRYRLALVTHHDTVQIGEKPLIVADQLSLFGHIAVAYDYKYVDLSPLTIGLNGSLLVVKGNLYKQPHHRTMNSDLLIRLHIPDISNFISSISPLQKITPRGLQIDESLSLTLHAQGPLSIHEKILPDMNMQLALKGGSIRYAAYPALQHVQLYADAIYQPTQKNAWVRLSYFKGDFFHSSWNLQGETGNLLAYSLGKWTLKGHSNLSDLSRMFPKPLSLQGKMAFNMHADLSSLRGITSSFIPFMKQLNLSGDIQLKQVFYQNDSLPSGLKDRSNNSYSTLRTFLGEGRILFRSAIPFDQYPQVRLILSSLSVSLDSAKSQLDTLQLKASLKDSLVMSTLWWRNLSYYQGSTLRLHNGTFYTDIRMMQDYAWLSKPKIFFQPLQLTCQSAIRSVYADWGENKFQVPSAGIYLQLNQKDSIPSQETLLNRYAINGGILIDSTRISTPILPLNNQVELAQVIFNSQELKIPNLSLLCGRSSLKLNATVSGWYDYLLKKDTVTAEMSLDADTLHLTQFVPALVKGLYALHHRKGNGVDSMARRVLPPDLLPPADSLKRNKERMLQFSPLLKLKANLNAATVIYDSLLLNRLQGTLLLNDRALWVQNFAATSDFGQIEVDASYRNEDSIQSVGSIGLSLLQLDLKDLLTLLPDVKKMVPMLSTLDGKVDCLLSGTAQIDSSMYLVLPSIQGGAIISGHQLSVEKKAVLPRWVGKLLFCKKKRITVDSIQVKMTMAQNLLNIYPLVVDIGRFRVLAQGVQNTDDSFFYHLALQKGLLPFPIGLNVYRTLRKTHFALTCAKLKNLDLPARILQVSPNQFYPESSVQKYIQTGFKTQQSTFVKFLDYYQAFLKKETHEISQKQTADILQRLNLLKDSQLSP